MTDLPNLVAIDAYTELAANLRRIERLKRSYAWRATAPYRWLGRAISKSQGAPAFIPYAEKDLSRAYYQEVHETHPAYQENNWLLTEIDTLLRCRPKTLIEIGCGNGRFLRTVSSSVERVVGLDWARSPLLTELPHNVRFQQSDLARDRLPSSDLACSADVLEHLHPDRVRDVVRKICEAARFQYHVIACYDDGHSHQTIVSPGVWLFYFQGFIPECRILDIRIRRGDPRQLICVIANF